MKTLFNVFLLMGFLFSVFSFPFVFSEYSTNNSTKLIIKDFCEGDECGTFPHNKTPVKEETPEERMKRMLSAFDREIIPGYVTFAFKKNVTKEEGVKILAKYDFYLIETKNEYCKSIVKSGIEKPKELGCETIYSDGWETSLLEESYARVKVPEGKEKYYGEKLVRENDEVIWAEPSYNYSVLDSVFWGASKNSRETKDARENGVMEKEGFFSKILNWIKSLFRNDKKERKEKKIKPEDFVCPQQEYIDCMPLVPPENVKYCHGEYHEWIVKNCNTKFSW